MLKKLTIRNFKAIQDMTIEFTPITVLIGGNSCGKSTILQALDFLRSSSYRDIPEYLREKGWNLKELKSQLDGGQYELIEFISIFEFLINKKNELVKWTFKIDQNDKKWIIKEKLENLSTKEELYSLGFGNHKPMIAGNLDAYAGNPDAIARDIREINLQSSWLKYIEPDKETITFALKEYLTKSMFFGILSPDFIRNGKEQTSNENIGQNGSALAVFIHNMTSKDKDCLDKTISQFIDFNINIKTIDIGKRIELYIDEKFDTIGTQINKDHISDGLLRIIAFVAISMEKDMEYLSTEDGALIITNSGEAIVTKSNESLKNGMVLLDEIENGINPYMTEQIVSLLRDLNEKQGRQIIVTTHSPVILNDFKPEEIIFLWKDKNGSVHSRKFFDTEEMKSLLEALNPGEIWINLEKEDILERLSVKKEGNG